MLRTMHVSHVQSKLYRSRFRRASSARASRLAPQEAAQELSKRADETTIFVESENRSTGVSRGRMANVQEGAGQTTSEKGRRLIFAHEITTMDPGKELQLLFVQGEDIAQSDPNTKHVEAALGSLAALGHSGSVPPRMAMSLDVDAYTRRDPARVFELGRELGQGSAFEAEHGYYLDPISPHVATLPAGFVAPRCYGVAERPDGTTWLWLEAIVDEQPGPWSLVRFNHPTFVTMA